MTYVVYINRDAIRYRQLYLYIGHTKVDRFISALAVCIARDGASSDADGALLQAAPLATVTW